MPCAQVPGHQPADGENMVLRFGSCLVLALLTRSVLAADPVAVTVMPLGDLLVDRELRAPATVISANRALVTSEVSALIQEVPGDVGDTIRKGETLVVLDDDNNRLMLAQARARLAALEAQIAQAQHRLDKAEELLEKDFVSDDELLARQTDLAVLKANQKEQEVLVRIQGLALSRTVIKAPFDAAIVERQAQVGSYAMPGTALMTIVQTDGREIDAEIDPRYAVALPTVSDLRFVSQGREWRVELSRLSSVIETDTRILRARLKFADDAAPIGLTGELVWNEATGLVPVAQIVQRGDALGIFVARSDTANFVPIPGAQEGRPAPVDLSPDALIVVRGQVRLQDGDIVSISRE
jgi:RND family efflux transporter MFP subunit